MTARIILKEDMNDIMKIVKSIVLINVTNITFTYIMYKHLPLLLIKGVSKTIKRGFFSILLGKSGASLLGNLLTG